MSTTLIEALLSLLSSLNYSTEDQEAFVREKGFCFECYKPLEECSDNEGSSDEDDEDYVEGAL